MQNISLTYQNPVYDQYMADPFIMAHTVRYYAYGTSPEPLDGRWFPVLESGDMVHWESRGGALYPPLGADEFWAPAVAFWDGVFVLYYSAHGIEGRDHQLRVATSISPLGPFQDTGQVLSPNDPFSIDAHPFQDADGQRYLFYAHDFLESSTSYRVGTGIVVDRLLDHTRLEGQPRLVVRPHADWQLFQTARRMYDCVYDWYTVEGPAVLVRNNRYYCFYSGGSWKCDNYGISYVVSDHPLGPYRLSPQSDGPILKSVPGKVIGPGHNSWVQTEGTGQFFAVYHAWDAARTRRLMRIDPVFWDNDQPYFDGPTWTPQDLFRTSPSNSAQEAG